MLGLIKKDCQRTKVKQQIEQPEPLWRMIYWLWEEVCIVEYFQ